MAKTLVIGLTVLGFLVTPALAQKYVPEAGSGNIVQGPGGAPVSPNTPTYTDRRSGDAYNYNSGVNGGSAIRHRKKKKQKQDD